MPTSTVTYLYGHDCLGESRDDEWLYYLNDGVGYVRQGADESGQVVSSWLFDPDGTVLEGPNGPVSHLICGGVYDWSTGLVHRDGRYFDPMLGIWLALAPLVVVQSWQGRKRKRHGMPWYVLLLVVVGVGSGMLTACGKGGTKPPENPPPTACSTPSTPPESPEPETPTPSGSEPEPPQEDPPETPSGKIAYITIDDGPGSFTSQVLNVLANYGVKATFFLLGEKIGDDTRHEVERMKSEGHAIGIHSWDHNWSRGADDQAWQIQETSKAIEEIIGLSPALFRAPGGAPTSADISGLYNYNWTVDTYDYKTSDPQTAADNIFQGVSDESVLPRASDREYTQAIAIDNAEWSKPIILMHSIHAVDPQALELIILGLQARGYDFGVLPRPGDSPGTAVPITNGS
jgi:peptidoglycan/xylan/chitin deacetylase (PgdA/CDA1 family)